MKDFRNNLLKRREIEFVVDSESNPGFENAKKSIVEKFNVIGDNVVIKHVKNNFGSREFMIEAFVYDSKGDKERIEPRKKEKVKTAAKKEAKEE